MQLGTYRQWQDYFLRLRQGECSLRELETADFGDPRLSGAAMDGFIRELEETVNVLLNRACRRFSRDLREVGETGELEEIPLLARRFRREVRGVLFIKRLTFLDGDYRRELEKAIRQQLEGTWQSFYRGLQRQAEQTPSAMLEDLIFSLRGFRLPDE